MLRKGADVRIGSKADVCVAKPHVRFTPNSDRKSRHATNGHVRFTPESGHVQCKPSCLLWAKSGHLDLTHLGISTESGGQTVRGIPMKLRSTLGPSVDGNVDNGLSRLRMA